MSEPHHVDQPRPTSPVPTPSITGVLQDFLVGRAIEENREVVYQDGAAVLGGNQSRLTTIAGLDPHLSSAAETVAISDPAEPRRRS